jgi:uncharacterized short protein YbdD (DUF466 family)
MNTPSGGRMLRLRSRLIKTAGQVRRAYLQIFGIPDYERYLAHAAAHHPGEPALSRRDFSARAIERKYSRAGPKCC